MAAGDNAFELLDALAASNTERATLRHLIDIASEHRDELSGD
jgi:hypothetical protein